MVTFCVLSLLLVAIDAAQVPARIFIPASGVNDKPHFNDKVPAHLEYPARDTVLDNYDKRVIASRLLRTAASHKQHSLRDVLTQQSTNHQFQQHPPREEAQKRPSRAESIRILHKTANEYFSNDKNESTVHQSISMHVNANTNEEDNSDKRRVTREQVYTSEKQILTDNVNKLIQNGEDSTQHKLSPNTIILVLRTIEELCHSMYNGEAITQMNGFRYILHLLDSKHRRVRSTAALAIATCSQNNKIVQNELLELNGLEKIAKLAYYDVLNVRSRALFALNALLGLEKARLHFESLPYSIHLLSATLKDRKDYRITRRSLNLIELLLRKNLDSWKTQLEAWDIPVVVEKLLRGHPDIDVRESAARIVATLDGKTVP